MSRLGILFILSFIVIMQACKNENSSNSNQEAVVSDSIDTVNSSFNFLAEQFADLKILRYQVPGFDELSLNKKTLIYYLSQAALYGRDITMDQNYKHNLCIRRTLEEVLLNYKGDKSSDEYKSFVIYLKRIWFSNGIHHHYSTSKIIPDFSREYFAELLRNTDGANFPLQEGEDLEQLISKLTPLIFDPDIDGKRVSQDSKSDLILASANNFYENVTQSETEDFYNAMRTENDPHPVSYGLNSKLIKEDGAVLEKVWYINGMYKEAIEKIVDCLEKALPFAEDEKQKTSISKLVQYYKTGSLKVWDEYNVAWVADLNAQVDFVNGFIENYGDPMSMKATWESVVNFKNIQATKRTQIISDNAQWFEDNSPVDPRFKKTEVKGVSAKVITVAQLGGDCYPSTPIGINLPNADWIRKEHGSKSVTMENITYAYDQASLSSGFMEEFSYSAEITDRSKLHGPLAGNLHTDLHECLGHGSGQLLPGVSSEVLKSYQSALEETRADLFALYYMMDPRMVELGLMPSLDVAKAEYDSYISNGIMWQLKRVKLGDNIEQAHMRNRQLIANWCFESGAQDSVIARKMMNGKTYFVITDYEKLRVLFGELLKEVQRIKSEGDYEAGASLVEKYGVVVDKELHAEMLERYSKLNAAPYGGFINPLFIPAYKEDSIVDVTVSYPDNYTEQMLGYSKDYSPLPTYN